MQKQTLTISPQHLIQALLLVGLLYLGYVVLQAFLLTLVWAFILAYVTWPIYQWLNNRISNHETLSAAIMTVILTLVLMIVVFGFINLLQAELRDTYQRFVSFLEQEHHPLPEFISQIPWLGVYLQDLSNELISDPSGLIAQLAQWSRQGLLQLAGFIGGIGSYTLKTGVLLVTVFFCYRDGHRILSQLQRGVIQFLGRSSRHVFTSRWENYQSSSLWICTCCHGARIFSGNRLCGSRSSSTCFTGGDYCFASISTHGSHSDMGSRGIVFIT